MHRSTDFRRAMRGGVRASTSTLVVHAVTANGSQPATVGFVVSKKVGNAVTRNQVKRRLRHAVRPHLGQLGHLLVVLRARPAAAGADYARLQRDLDRCLSTVVGARC
jgi:ribonuclease P protein component